MSKPYLWICFAGTEPVSDIPGAVIRAWTGDPERAKQMAGNGLEMKPLFDLSDADAVRDMIARAIYRYQEGPGTFDKPGGIMGDLLKKICTDEAENIRRAIVGEPPLPMVDEETRNG